MGHHLRHSGSHDQRVLEPGAVFVQISVLWGQCVPKCGWKVGACSDLRVCGHRQTMQVCIRLLEAEMWKNKCKVCCLNCEECDAFAAFMFKPVCGSGILFGLAWLVFSLSKSLEIELSVFCHRSSMQDGQLTNVMVSVSLNT